MSFGDKDLSDRIKTLFFLLLDSSAVEALLVSRCCRLRSSGDNERMITLARPFSSLFSRLSKRTGNTFEENKSNGKYCSPEKATYRERDAEQTKRCLQWHERLWKKASCVDCGPEAPKQRYGKMLVRVVEPQYRDAN